MVAQEPQSLNAIPASGCLAHAMLSVGRLGCPNRFNLLITRAPRLSLSINPIFPANFSLESRFINWKDETQRETSVGPRRGHPQGGCSFAGAKAPYGTSGLESLSQFYSQCDGDRHVLGCGAAKGLFLAAGNERQPFHRPLIFTRNRGQASAHSQIRSSDRSCSK